MSLIRLSTPLPGRMRSRRDQGATLDRVAQRPAARVGVHAQARRGVRDRLLRAGHRREGALVGRELDDLLNPGVEPHGFDRTAGLVGVDRVERRAQEPGRE